MSLLQQQGIPTQMNGERVIKIIRGKDHFNSATFQGMIDRNELLFEEDHRRYHLLHLECKVKNLLKIY